MTTFFAPAEFIMNNLSYRMKFVLVSILFLIPLCYLLGSNWIDGGEHLRADRKKRAGLEYVVTLNNLTKNMAVHRGLTSAFLNGNASVKDRISEAETKVNDALNQLATLDTNHPYVNLAPSLDPIRVRWKALLKRNENMLPSNNFEEHTALIASTMMLSEDALHRSGLAHDPKTYRIGGLMLASAIPQLSEILGQTRGRGAGLLASGEFSPDTFISITTAFNTIKRERETFQHQINSLKVDSPDAYAKIQSSVSDASNAIDEFIALTKANIVDASELEYDSTDYFKTGTEAIAAIGTLGNQLIEHVSQTLDQQDAEIASERIISTALIGLITVLIIYLYVGFYVSVIKSVRRLQYGAESVANGDLSKRVNIESNDEMKGIADAFNLMIDNLASLVNDLKSAIGQITSSASNLDSSASTSRNTINLQKDQIQLVATAVNEMSATVNEVSQNCTIAADAAQTAADTAASGNTVVNNAVKAIDSLAAEIEGSSGVINQLRQDSESIGVVLDVIRGIAEQTNLLALNAAIEAARAGEQGRGFAVVADEVRTLASRTQQSTQEIQDTIEKLQQGAEKAAVTMTSSRDHAAQTVEVASEAGEALNQIQTVVSEINNLNTMIATASEEQASVAQEIDRNVVEINSGAEKSVEAAGATSKAANDLKAMAGKLESLVGRFRL